jgi:hypothetical protein
VSSSSSSSETPFFPLPDQIFFDFLSPPFPPVPFVEPLLLCGPFPDFPPFPALPQEGMIDGNMDGISEGTSNGIEEMEGA